MYDQKIFETDFEGKSPLKTHDLGKFLKKWPVCRKAIITHLEVVHGLAVEDEEEDKEDEQQPEDVLAMLGIKEKDNNVANVARQTVQSLSDEVQCPKAGRKLLNTLHAFLDENPVTNVMAELKTTHVAFIKMNAALMRGIKNGTDGIPQQPPADDTNQEAYALAVLKSAINIFDKHVPLQGYKVAAEIAEVLTLIPKYQKPAPTMVLADAFEKLPWLAEFVEQLWPNVGALEAFIQSRFRYMMALIQTWNGVVGSANSAVEGFATFIENMEDDFLPYDDLQTADAKDSMMTFWKMVWKVYQDPRYKTVAVASKSDSVWTAINATEKRRLKELKTADLRVEAEKKVDNADVVKAMVKDQLVAFCLDERMKEYREEHDKKRSDWLLALDKLAVGDESFLDSIPSPTPEGGDACIVRIVDGVNYIPLFLGLGSGNSLVAWKSQALARHATDELLKAWAPHLTGDLRDQQSSSIMMKKSDSTKPGSVKMFLDFAKDKREAVEKLKLFFVGQVLVTMTDGSMIKGKRLDAGNVTISDRVYYLSIVPDLSLSGCNSALCVPAWEVKATKPKKDGESDESTMALRTQEVDMTFDDVEFKVKVHYLVAARFGSNLIIIIITTVIEYYC